MGDVLVKFLEPLQRQYPLPKHAEGHETEFWKDYLRILKSFDDETLEKAADNIIGTRAARTFPNPAECNKACKETIEAEAIKQMESGREHARREHDLLEKRYPECSQPRIEAANRMMQDYPLIKQAADEFWIWGLFDFCCKNRSTPDKYQVERIKAKSNAVIRDLVKAIGDSASVENAVNMRGNLLGMWLTAQNKHRDTVGLPPVSSEELTALLDGYRRSEAA